MPKSKIKNAFQFKYFQVKDDKSTMGVGTDAVLLGAWIPIDFSPKRILDVGVGCGVISLSLAQRLSPGFKLLGIDVDELSVAQCKENFLNSPWYNSLEASYIPYQDLLGLEPFDLILSNPPYFRNSLLAPDTSRSNARHQETFDMNSFAKFCNSNLSLTGKVTMVYPAGDLAFLTKCFENQGFTIDRLLLVQAKAGLLPNRVLVSFSKQQIEKSLVDYLTIYEADHTYTSAYKQLTKDYYLNF
jgi:tRNA1Val (adenine37-N6)-methyltransferase